jgi:tyrosyl-tRNA synthetase
MTAKPSSRPSFRPVDEQLTVLRKGIAEIIREEELRARLERSRASGAPLRVKLGVDPTAPDLHLGHTVVLRKLKHFQDQGHTAIFLIGDFTAMVGDPTGQSETRPPLSPEQVKANSETYLQQVYKILDRERTEVRYNSEWLGKLTSYEIVKLQGHYRLARMLEREDFRSRLAQGQPISVHELLYPLLQAYDSVVLKADIELGATEQKFNLLVGRDIQQEYGQESQVALTMPILVGLDGQRKMSKSLGNYVGITESPSQMFGKIMSVSDELMWSYYELLTDFAEPVVVRLKEEIRSGVLHPMETKMQLAHTIIAGFHGEEAAKKATDEFQRVFRERQAPEDLTEYRLRRARPGLAYLHKQGKDGESNVALEIPANDREKWARLLVSLGTIPSKAEADRLIKQRAVEINGDIVADIGSEIAFDESAVYTVRVGKKNFFRVVVE